MSKKQNAAYYLSNQKHYRKIDSDKIFKFKSPICSDTNEILLKFEDNKISDAAYVNFGCGINAAVLEILCDYLIGKEPNELQDIDMNMIKDKLDFPERKLHCVNLVFDTLKNT